MRAHARALRVVAALASLALASACGARSRSTSPAPSGLAWDSMNAAQKMAYMQTTVMPRRVWFSC